MPKYDLFTMLCFSEGRWETGMGIDDNLVIYGEADCVHQI